MPTNANQSTALQGDGKSEVARIRADIDRQAQAAQMGLSGLAAVANHESIIARMEQEALPVLQLFEQGHVEEAINLWMHSSGV